MVRRRSAVEATYHLLERRSYPANLSLVIPMYNEDTVVNSLRADVDKFLAEVKCETEVLLINDGSTDRTLPMIVAWAAADGRVKIIHLSRNFGHQVAVTAGLDHARGDAIVLVDADLQDPLSVIHQMIDRYCEGYDVVYGQREKRRGESILKRFTAWLFYRMMRAMVFRNLPLDTGDFRLISRQCLNGLQSMPKRTGFCGGWSPGSVIPSAP